MNGKRILDAVGGIDYDLIEDAERPRRGNRPARLAKWGALAACLMVLLGSAVTAAVLRRARSEPKARDMSGDGAGDGAVYTVNLTAACVRTGTEWKLTDEAGYAYLSERVVVLTSALRASGVPVETLSVSPRGYAHIRMGADGNTISENWRDFLLYDGNRLAAIAMLFRDQTGIFDSLAFGAPWFSDYADLLKAHAGEELIYLYIGDAETILTPENDAYTLAGTPFSGLADGTDYYSFFRNEEVVFIPAIVP